MSKSKPRTAAAAHRISQLNWYQSLQFKLALLFLFLVILLGAAAVVSGKLLIGDKLVAETFRYELESGRRLAGEFANLAQRVQDLAAALAKLSANTPGGPQAVRPPIPKLVDGYRDSRLIASVGIWPEPKTLDPARERASLFWVRDSTGALDLHEDYNDARTVPYYREKWYTPARYSQESRCYWTPVYREPLTKQDVITCTMPMRNANGFAGAVTVSLTLASIGAEFAKATGDDIGYSLLVDSDNRLLAVSAKAAGKIGTGNARPRNLAELAKALPSFNSVALTLHKQDEERLSAVARSPLYKASEVAALKDATRDMSSAEAEASLSQIWSALGNYITAKEPANLQIEDDAILGDTAFASTFQLSDTHWRLLRVTPAKEGFTGANYIFLQSLVVTGGGVVLGLLLVFSSLRFMVISPLRKMTRQLAAAGSTEDSLNVVVDESARNEVGVLAFWLNERVRQLRELMERTVATNSQLVMESEERRKAQEALARIQERSTLALQSVADGVITADEAGNIEDMNPVAEQLTGVPLRAGRGKNFAVVFVARMGGDSGARLPNLARIAIQRGTRLEYAEGVSLTSFGGAQRDIHLTVTPIRTRHNRVIGAVIVFREKPKSAAGVAAAQLAADKKAIDATTGLPTRAACDRRLRALIEAARLSPRTHVLLFLDVDHLKRINDNGGQQAGDEVLAKVGEILVSKTGNAGEVFRLASDQFGVVLENFNAQRGRVFAEALRAALANTRFYWESKHFSVTASFGVTDFSDSEESPVGVICRADDACAAAKRAGRNCVKVYDPSMNRAGREADDEVWVRRIRAGLDQNMFHLTTQFIMPIQTSASEGNAFEILLALEDEEGFWTAPVIFMPAAERHHLAMDVDRWVIKHTLAHLAQHPETLEKLAFVNIKLSTGSLADSTLLEFITALFEQSNKIYARKICFEIHENDLIEYPKQVQILCGAMHSVGYRLAIGHFQGRNPADLALIRKLPVDFLRVDAQHFKNITSDQLEQMLADSAVRLARAMQKRVVAYNLDDKAQISAWRRLGLDYYQGLAIAKPSPVVFIEPKG